MAQVDYSTVTELPGVGAHRSQLAAMRTRYEFAAGFCEGRDVLEVACGSGMGLGYLARPANRVVGLDIDDTCLSYAEETYRDRSGITVVKSDAQNLPFEDHCFDVVLMCEAIYYLPDASVFVSEAKRVLRTGGTLIIVTVNRKWQGFNASPFSVRYFSAQELADLLSDSGFEPRILLGFKDRAPSLPGRLKSGLRRLAVGLRLIPKTMHGKQWLKRLFYGTLAPIERELRPSIEVERLIEATDVDGCADDYQVIYAAAELVGQRQLEQSR